MLCWLEGGAGFFLFSVLPGGAVELPARSRPALGVSTFAGVGSRSSSRSRFSGWALAVFIPWRGADGFRPARGMAPALMLCWLEGGAGFFLQRNGYRNRSEFSGKAKIGQALEQTICLLLL